MEVLNQVIISYELNYMNLEKYENIRLQIEKVGNKLNGLKSFQLNAKSKQNK